MPNEPDNGQLNNNPSIEPQTGLSEFNATDYLGATQTNTPYTNGYVSNYLGSISGTRNKTPNLTVGAYGITNDDYFPGRSGILAGNYQGSIVGNVPIFTQGENLFPFAVLEKRRDALNQASMQYFERSLQSIDVQRKPLKNELLADKLNDVVLQKTDYFINEARKIDPAYGIELMMAGKAGTLSEEWRKFRSDVNTWSGQFDYVQDAAVKTEQWAAEGFYITPDFKKVMYDVLQGADNVENGVMTGEGEKVVNNLKRYASIPQITKDILQNVVMTQTVEYLDANGKTVSTNLSSAIDNAKRENNTTLLQELTTKYLSDEQLDNIVGGYVTSLHGDLFYGQTKFNGQPVNIPKDENRLYDYQSLYTSLRGMAGIQKGVQLTQIQEPRGTNVTVNNVEPKDVSPASSWLVNSFKTLYSEATGDEGNVFIDAKNYAMRTGAAIKFVVDGVEKYVSISDRDAVVSTLAEMGARQPKVTGIGEGLPAASLSLNTLSNELLTESLSFAAKQQEKLATKKWNVGTFEPYAPESGETNETRISVDGNGLLSLDKEESAYNIVGFLEANGESISIPVQTTQGTYSSLSLSGVSKVGTDGYYLESNGRKGIIIPTQIAQSSSGATNVQSEDASNLSIGTQFRWVEGVYYKEGDKGNYQIVKLGTNEPFEEAGSDLTFPKSGITAAIKEATTRQIVEPYNSLKSKGIQDTGAKSYTMTQNVSGQEPYSATLDNRTFDVASFNNMLVVASKGQAYWKENNIKKEDIEYSTKIMNNVINMYQDALEPGKEKMYYELWGQFDNKVRDAVKVAYNEYTIDKNYTKLAAVITMALQPKMASGTLRSYGQYVNYYK